MPMTDTIACKPIGVVKCRVTRMSEGHWGEVESEIHVDPAYARGLDGLQAFSHVTVVFFLHEVGPFVPAKHLLRHPRDMKNLPEVGVFAQRTKYRPNPIGVTSAELREVRDNVVIVRGLDALDGTPVLDIKPYVPLFDRVENARTPEWISQFGEGYM